MQLLRNNCRIRANVFVILVAATNMAWGFIQDRRLRTDVFFIRAQATIRADGFSSAQVLPKPARCARQPCFWYG